jgi:hypothetical protein
VYRHRYTSKVRPVADRIGVPVPNSGIPREWVDAARANLELEERVWSAVSAILTDPEKLRTGLDEMIEQNVPRCSETP